jgi:hypothetical protein
VCMVLCAGDWVTVELVLCLYTKRQHFVTQRSALGVCLRAPCCGCALCPAPGFQPHQLLCLQQLMLAVCLLSILCCEVCLSAKSAPSSITHHPVRHSTRKPSSSPQCALYNGLDCIHGWIVADPQQSSSLWQEQQQMASGTRQNACHQTPEAPEAGGRQAVPLQCPV